MVKEKDIIVYTLDKKEVGKFKSAKEVSEELSIPIGSVYALLTKNSKRKSTYGYQIKWEGAEPLDLTNVNTDARKPKKIFHYSRDGKELLHVYESTLEASENIEELTQSGVSAIVNKKKLTSNTTYNLRFEGDKPQDLVFDTMYSVYDLKGKECLGMFNTMEEALEHYDIPLSELKDNKQTKYRNIHKGIQVIRNRYLKQLKEIYYFKVVQVEKTGKNEFREIEGTEQRFNTLEEVGNELNVVRERVRQAVKEGTLVSNEYFITKE